MSKKFHIKGCQNIQDDIELSNCQTTNIVLNPLKYQPCLKTRQKQQMSMSKSFNDSESISKLSTGGQMRCQTNNQHNRSRFKSLNTVCKSIKKFKEAHKKKHVRTVVNRTKVNNNVNLFVEKISRSLPRHDVKLQSELRQNVQKNNFLMKNGILLPHTFEIFQIIFNTINYFFLFCLFSFGVVFHEQFNHKIVKSLQAISSIVIFMNTVLNFTKITVINGKRLENIMQISKNYLKGSFITDFICLFILIMDICSDKSWMRFVRIFYLCKFKDFIANIEKLQYNFINTFYREHYWGIGHLILSNFFVAHIIAIIVLLIGQIDPENNWLIRAKISQSSWYEKYIWAYYWAVTTMLSIGYGDIVVSNYIEAACMVFVQTFSCIILAYTINSVGILINKLKSQNLQKNKNLKLMKQIADKNNISRKVQQKMGNFINQTIQIKTRFNYEDQKKLLNSLPKDIRTDVLKQCNSKLLKNIQIFRCMSQAIITQLANKIELKIAHPQQIIFSPTNYQKLQILKQGKVCYFTNIKQDIINKRYAMNQLIVEPGSQSCPLSLNFMTHDVPNYVITSMKYSVLYVLSKQNMEQCLKYYQIDNEKYCEMRDKSKHILYQFQIIQCEICNKKHTKSNCPKLHYIPLKQNVIYKYLVKSKKMRSKRVPLQRERISDHPYKVYGILKNLRQENQYINLNTFDENYNMNTVNTMNSVTQVILDYLLGVNVNYQKIRRLYNNNSNMNYNNNNNSNKNINQKINSNQSNHSNKPLSSSIQTTTKTLQKICTQKNSSSNLLGNSRHRNGVNFKEMYGNFNNYINNESNKSMNANININNGNECHVKIPKTNIVKKKKSQNQQQVCKIKQVFTQINNLLKNNSNLNLNNLNLNNHPYNNQIQHNNTLNLNFPSNQRLSSHTNQNRNRNPTYLPLFPTQTKIKFPKNLALITQLTTMMGIECDTLYDYSYYFIQMNPKNIHQKHLQVSKSKQQSRGRMNIKRFFSIDQTLNN